VKWRVFTVAVVSAGALVQGAQSIASPQTTSPPPIVDIKVTITDTGIRMSPGRALRGDYARFTLLNVGKQPHTFAFGTAKRGTGAQSGFTKPLKPHEQKVLLLFLDYRGKVAYYGSLAADRSKPGMKGVFRIN
jgi:hypothetical protein